MNANQAQWTAVDQYITHLLIPPDPALEAALAASSAAGLPQIQVTSNVGKLLQLFARMLQARRILEIGTLAGYSTIWLARALPAEGELITLESVPTHADVARANIARAGLSHRVDLRVAPALQTLPDLNGPFDLIFIDADKEQTSEYFNHSLRLSRPGSLIIVDNVIRDGAVTDSASTDSRVQGIRRFNELLAAEKRVSATQIQTVGSKGYDGLAIALVIAEPDARL
jgi:predicted O-methyltransferase YrrM